MPRSLPDIPLEQHGPVLAIQQHPPDLLVGDGPGKADQRERRVSRDVPWLEGPPVRARDRRESRAPVGAPERPEVIGPGAYVHDGDPRVLLAAEIAAEVESGLSDELCADHVTGIHPVQAPASAGTAGG